MARKRKNRSLLLRLIQLSLVVVALILIFCNLWVLGSTGGRVFSDVSEIESNPVGLVLGTSKKVAPETANPHFENRVAAAAELYHEGKIERLIVSGHREKYYDEPGDMIAKLRELGVPASVLTRDDAGHRTLDSVVRARKVFDCDQITIISDDFHVNRALFIADRVGLNAVAFRGERVEFEESMQARVREYLARVKAVLDLYFLGTEPSELSGMAEG
ncbi:MAG: DUF218 domain-containing protein [Verrucomicrobiales bacterium]|nr:DUF218 domain-containing protein [Verrucomicrobiales bacterium]